MHVVIKRSSARFYGRYFNTSHISATFSAERSRHWMECRTTKQLFTSKQVIFRLCVVTNITKMQKWLLRAERAILRASDHVRKSSTKTHLYRTRGNGCTMRGSTVLRLTTRWRQLLPIV